MEKVQLEARISKILHILATQLRLPGYRSLKLKRVLPQLVRAIEKIKEESYGFCDDCDLEIPKERLDVIPGAIRCVDCQKKFERALFLSRHL